MRLAAPGGSQLVLLFLLLAAMAANIACGGVPPHASGTATTITAPPSSTTPAITPANPVTVPQTAAVTSSPPPASATIPHQVDLSWNPSASLVDGYFVYRSAQSGGPYVRLNALPVAITSYSDLDVAAGQTYYYVVAATMGTVESIFSNEIEAAVPAP